MTAATYSRIAGAIFTLIALIHAYRLVAFFPVEIGSVSVPYAGSWVGLVIAGALGLLGLRAKP